MVRGHIGLDMEVNDMTIRKVTRSEERVVLEGENGEAIVFGKDNPLYRVEWFEGMRASDCDAGYLEAGCVPKEHCLFLRGRMFRAKNAVEVCNAIVATLPHPGEVVLTGEVGDDGVFMTELGSFDVTGAKRLKEGRYVIMGKMDGDEDRVEARVARRA